MIGEYRADGTKSNWHYRWSNVDGESYKLEKNVLGFSTETEVYDAHDRMIKKITSGMNDENIFEDIVYNRRGLIVKRSVPHYKDGSVIWNDFQYDVLGRLISTKKSDGVNEVMTEFTYQGQETTEINPLGNTKVTERDVLGRIITVTDAKGGQSKYKYDPVGNILEVTNPSGLKIIMTYDLMGQKRTLDDPQMGKWGYKHNAFGELIWQKDANGDETSQKFDKLGRKIVKKNKDGISTWTYDGKNAIGKLSLEKSPDGMEKKWNYDIFGREHTVLTIVGKEKFEIENTYDDFGRLIVQKFPNGREVHRCYDENGYLLRVQQYKCSIRISFFWQAQQYDALGRVTEEKHGNGIETVYSYNFADDLIQIRSKGKDGKITLRNVQYQYDKNHNLKKRIKSNMGHETIETFRYDSLDRLLRGSLQAHDGKFGMTETWGYDASGNIIYDNKFGQRHFIYDENKPHAVKTLKDFGT